MLSIHLIVSSLAVFNSSNTVGWGSAQAEKKFFVNTQMSTLSCRMKMRMGGNWKLLDAKEIGMGLKFHMRMGMGWEWERSH